ncbi:hypothetical protein H4R24_000467 [Coemansia sp. RSA 988]|nr:hypothetical protein H4R24_000467 [Coemansia sp. RSA 988]
MGKRSAEKQLTQLNQYDEENEGDSQGKSFQRATGDALAGRVIRKPKSRLRPQPTTSEPAPTPAFSGFGGFDSRPPATATNSNGEESAEEEPAAKGVFKGFTFGQSANNKGSSPAFVFGSGTTSSSTAAAKPPMFGADKFGTSASQKPSSMATGGFNFGLQDGTGFGAFKKPAGPTAGSFGSIKASSSAADTPASNPFSPAKAGESAPKDSTAPDSTNKSSGFSMPAFKPPTAAPTATNATTTKATGFSMPAFKPPTTLTTTASKDPADKPKPVFSMPAFKPPTFSSLGGGGGGGGGGDSSGKIDSSTAAFQPGLAQSNSGTDKLVPPGRRASVERENLFRNVRGLNASLQKKINDALQINAFVDLTPLLSQYCDHWKKISGERQSTPTKISDALSTASPRHIPLPTGSAPWGSSAANFVDVNKKADHPPQFAFSKFTDTTSGSGGGDQTDSLSRSSQPTTLTERTSKPFSSGFTSPAFVAGSSASVATSKPTFSFSFDKNKQDQTETSNSTVDQIKKPFSFSFSSSASTAGSSNGQGGTATQKPSFNFGFGNSTDSQVDNSNDAGPKSADTNGNDMSDVEEGGEAEEEGTREDVPKSPTTAGEEGETTVHQARVKLYQWDKGKGQYKDMGVGILKLNTSTKDDGSMRARLLCRQTKTEKITLNQSMFKEMLVEYKDDKVVGWLGLVDGIPTRFMTRQKLPSDAKALKQAIDKVLGEL